MASTSFPPLGPEPWERFCQEPFFRCLNMIPGVLRNPQDPVGQTWTVSKEHPRSVCHLLSYAEHIQRLQSGSKASFPPCRCHVELLSDGRERVMASLSPSEPLVPVEKAIVTLADRSEDPDEDRLILRLLTYSKGERRKELPSNGFWYGSSQDIDPD